MVLVNWHQPLTSHCPAHLFGINVKTLKQSWQHTLDISIPGIAMNILQWRSSKFKEHKEIAKQSILQKVSIMQQWRAHSQKGPFADVHQGYPFIYQSKDSNYVMLYGHTNLIRLTVETKKALTDHIQIMIKTCIQRKAKTSYQKTKMLDSLPSAVQNGCPAW